MKVTTTGEYIIISFLQCTDTMVVDLPISTNKLFSMTFDRAISIIRINKGNVALLKKHIRNVKHIGNLIKLLCFVSQEA